MIVSLVLYVCCLFFEDFDFELDIFTSCYGNRKINEKELIWHEKNSDKQNNDSCLQNYHTHYESAISGTVSRTLYIVFVC